MLRFFERRLFAISIQCFILRSIAPVRKTCLLLFLLVVSVVIVATCYGTPPVADFTWSEDSQACGRVEFTNYSYGPDEGGVLWSHWYFGFGSFAGIPEGAENPVVIYPGSAGDTYEVTLRVKKPGEESHQISKTVTLSCTGNHAPWLGGEQVDHGVSADPVHFYVDYHDPDGDDPTVHKVDIVQENEHQMWELSGSPGSINGATYRCDVTGLQPGTYKYSFIFKDPEGIQALDYGGPSRTLVIEGDTTPPSPDPMTWAAEPHATSPTEISMTASTASDPSGVEYYFDETTGNGHDSGWQDSSTYIDSGLSANTQYCYKVRARDNSTNQNKTGWSSSKSVVVEHRVSTPSTPTGPSSGQVGDSLDFSTGGSTCSQGHSVQYRFDWDNGDYSCHWPG